MVVMCQLICQLGDLTFLTRPFLLMAQGDSVLRPVAVRTCHLGKERVTTGAAV